MEDYRKPRIAITALKSAEELLQCILELVASKRLDPLALYVLASSEAKSSEFESTAETRLTQLALQQVYLVEEDQKSFTIAGQVTENDWVDTKKLRDFTSWLDERSGRRLLEYRNAGMYLLFVHIGNALQEASIYKVLSTHGTGVVQIHDLSNA